MEQAISQKQAMHELNKGYVKAKKIIKNKESFDELLERVEKRLKAIPKNGENYL
jgi:hypothetical protein